MNDVRGCWRESGLGQKRDSVEMKPSLSYVRRRENCSSRTRGKTVSIG